jgi:uncharacterized membrane protein YhaH (DUF805 family)
MGDVYVFALTAAANPTLLAAVTLMLTLERPKRLLLGYWLGAMLTIVTWGLVLVFAVSGSSSASTTKHTVSPAIDITLGALILVIVFVVATGRDRRRRARRERRREKAGDKPPPRWKRTMSKGSARDTFVIAILLSFPGASFIAGMDQLSKQKIGTTATVLAVVSFALIELLILEVPLVGYTVRPEWTEAAVGRFSDWLKRRGGRVAVIGGFVVGVLLIIRGIASLN